MRFLCCAWVRVFAAVVRILVSSCHHTKCPPSRFPAHRLPQALLDFLTIGFLHPPPLKRVENLPVEPSHVQVHENMNMLSESLSFYSYPMACLNERHRGRINVQ